MIQMYVDDWRNPYFIRTAADVPAEGRWVFNAPFYFLLNLAVGGEWPGPPDAATPSPAEMEVDYVRVYKASCVEAPMMRAAPLTLADGMASATVQMTSRSGGGFVYLACATESAVSACSVDTGNALNASVADFSVGETQAATVTVRPAGGRVTITAYSVSGEQSSVVIPMAAMPATN